MTKNKSKAKRNARKSQAQAAKKPRVTVQVVQPSRKQGKKARKRARRNAGAKNTGMPGSRMVTDGLSYGRVITNTSTIEDTFQTRVEKIGTVTGATAWAIQQALYVNPGNTVLFPIFSQIAATYEQYVPLKIKAHYVTRSYAASGSNVTAGEYTMATNHDPDDNQFQNETQMQNYAMSVHGPPYSETMTHDILESFRRSKPAMSTRSLYVYSSGNSAAPSNSTAKFYDVGLFQTAIGGTPDSTSIMGDLFIEYQFKMINPKQQTPLGQNLLYAHIVESAAATGAAATPLGTTGGVLRAGSTIPSVLTTTSFTLPVAGTYQISMSFSGANIAAAPTLTAGAGGIMTTVAIMVDNAVGSRSISSSAVGNYIGVWAVSSSGTGTANTFTIGGLTSGTGLTADVFISQVSSGITLRELETKSVSNSMREKELEDKFKALTLLFNMQAEQINHLTRLVHTSLAHDRPGDSTDSEPEAANSDPVKVKKPKKWKLDPSSLTADMAQQSSSSSSSSPPKAAGKWF